MRNGMILGAALCALAGTACDSPAESDRARVEAAYLADRVNGALPPAPICEQGTADQLLVYESVALSDDDTYGRLQQTRIDDGPIIQQEEFGEFVRTDSTILLVNAEDDTLTLTLLDEDGEYVRRIHPCGDTLRYVSVAVAD